MSTRTYVGWFTFLCYLTFSSSLLLIFCGVYDFFEEILGGKRIKLGQTHTRNNFRMVGKGVKK